MKIAPEVLFNFDKLAEVKLLAKDLMSNFDANSTSLTKVNVQEYRPLAANSEFLVPVYISWRKSVDAPTILESKSISDKRKKIIRQAISQSEKQGIVYKVENPLSPLGFQTFLAFYEQFNRSQGYDLLLNSDYYQKNKPENLYLISIYNREGQLLGGRMISKYENKISTDYRAIERTKLIKEGYDTVCEKIYYDLAVQAGIKYMGRGKEFNLRGLEARSIGMLWNKLKYGYQPFLLRKFPRVYVDFSFLREKSFDLVFFVSLENKPGFETIKEQTLILNFVCGNEPNWQEINSVKEKSLYKVNVYNRDFQLLDSLES